MSNAQLRFECLSCLGGKHSDLALVRFNRPPTDEEWHAFAIACGDFCEPCESVTPAMFEAGNTAQHPDDCTDVREIYRAMRVAQAGEAGTAETTKIGSVHEHAVRKDAPNK